VNLLDATTPCALVERSIIRANCRKMSSHIQALGARLRPHVKTHKCAEAALLQTAGHFGGITVSTLAEAEFFFDAAFTDITYAVPLTPNRVERVLALRRKGLELSVLVDSMEAPASLTSRRSPDEPPVPVFLKVDCGYGRAGVQPDSEAALALARHLHEAPALDFRGVLSHAGHSYNASNVQQVRGIALQERDITVSFAQRLRKAGIPCPEVSIGSTPTCVHTQDLTGVTEVRPGNYVFFDLVQFHLGSCDRRDIAISVLTTIIGSYPERGRLILDAGALALSKDSGAAGTSSFGQICDLDGEPIQGLTLSSLSQEHGLVDVAADVPIHRFPVGGRLRILPNHSCLTAACHGRYEVVENGSIVSRWEAARGW
jgi:D-serine deaminase-like pyridoxal phosphate-dependent protein